MIVLQAGLYMFHNHMLYVAVRDRKTRSYVQRTGRRPASGLDHPVRPYSQMAYDDDDVDYMDEAQWVGIVKIC